MEIAAGRKLLMQLGINFAFLTIIVNGPFTASDKLLHFGTEEDWGLCHGDGGAQRGRGKWTREQTLDIFRTFRVGF